MPNVENNRRADEMLAEDQAACRRVRLTVRLSRALNMTDEVVHLRNGTSRKRGPDDNAVQRNLQFTRMHSYECLEL